MSDTLNSQAALFRVAGPAPSNSASSQGPAPAAYEQTLREASDRSRHLSRLDWILSCLRLLIAVTGLLLVAGIWRVSLVAAGLVAAFSVACFVAARARHEDVICELQELSILRDLTQSCVERLSGEWTRRKDTGTDLADANHPYAGDLDVFGPGSLFQYCSAATTDCGRHELQSALTNNHGASIEDRRQIQTAIRELAARLRWRQNLQVTGLMQAGSGSVPVDPAGMDARAESGLLVVVCHVLPVATVAALILGTPVFIAAGVVGVIVQWSILRAMRPRIMQMFSSISAKARKLRVYSDMLRMIEEESFTSEHLQALQRRLRNSPGQTASETIEFLARIAELTDARHAPMLHIPLNLFLMWDAHCLFRYTTWCRRSGSFISDWFRVIGRFEAISSLAAIHFENPDWVFPAFVADTRVFDATGTGHPLIHTSRNVRNDISLGDRPAICVVTGSNMTGKSTFLRTIGLNVVLANAGAPVCASSMRLSTLAVFCCMRTGDSLLKGQSSFHAELLRIKAIVDSAEAGTSLLFLVDELFRGTNSRDRHAGSLALLRRLSALPVIGLAATHDVEICDLENEKDGRFSCFHFQEEYSADTIVFDYKLRSGRSTTTNAMHLIAKLGLVGKSQPEQESMGTKQGDSKTTAAAG